MSTHYYLPQYFKTILLVIIDSGFKKKIRPKLCPRPKLGRLRYPVFGRIPNIAAEHSIGKKAGDPVKYEA